MRVHLPNDLYYTAGHVWVRVEDEKSTRAGVTDYFRMRLRRIVQISNIVSEISLRQFQPFLKIKSVKTMFNLESPLSGRVRRVNDEVMRDPWLIHVGPYGEGWIVLMEPTRLHEEKVNLMTAKQYYESVKIFLEYENRLLEEQKRIFEGLAGSPDRSESQTSNKVSSYGIGQDDYEDDEQET